MLQNANIFVTGGAGTLGRAIARRRQIEGWTGRFTVYSRDEHKHAYMRRMFPDVQFVQGDIRNLETLKLAMVGHDVVVHAGACKVIPVSEYQSLDTIDINVYGSQNVCIAARETGVGHVLGISTDKACHAANAYGASKYLMEKVFQEYARVDDHKTRFLLVRYGNVLESTGSVVEAWKTALYNGQPVRITDPDMTRFWLSPSQAVDYVLRALTIENGQIFIPGMPALTIGKLLEYSMEEEQNKAREGKRPDIDIQRVPLRPGEKLHETLLTSEEGYYLASVQMNTNGTRHPHAFVLNPTTHQRTDNGFPAYSSDVAPELTKEQLEELLHDREPVS